MDCFVGFLLATKISSRKNAKRNFRGDIVSQADLPASFTRTREIEIGPDQRRTAQRGENSLLLRRFAGTFKSRHASLCQPPSIISSRSFQCGVDHGGLLPPNITKSISG